MNQPLSQLECWWFESAPAARLAMLRMLVGAFALNHLLDRLNLYTTTGSAERFHPVGMAWYLTAPLLRYDLQVLYAATCVSGLLFILGWKYRYVGPIFAASLLALVCYRNSWGTVDHSMNLLVLHVAILGVARSADAWSLDAWLAKRGKSLDQRAAYQLYADSGWQYGFPIRLICALTLLTYFVAGVAKIAGPLGWSWVWGESLRSQVAVNALRKEILGDDPSQTASALYHHVWLFTCAGIGSLLLELAAPAVLWKRRLAQVWAISALLMHWSIYFVMDIKFRYQLSGIAFAAFFPVEYPFLATGQALRRLGGHLSIPVVRPQR